MKYRRRPLEVEVVRWTGTNLEEIKNFAGDLLSYTLIDLHRVKGATWERGNVGLPVRMTLHTFGGDVPCNQGDYFIKEESGEMHICSPGIFEEIYEEAE